MCVCVGVCVCLCVCLCVCVFVCVCVCVCMCFHELVSWCFEPSQPQRITSRLDTNLTLPPSYSFHKSSYHMSCFLSLFIFHGHSTREPAPSRVTYFILRAYTGTGVSHSKGICVVRNIVDTRFQILEVAVS